MSMTWAEFKALVDAWNVKKLIRHTPIDGSGNYQKVWMNFEGELFEVTNGLAVNSSELTEFETSYKQNPTYTYVVGKNINRNDIAGSFNTVPGDVATFDLKLTSDTTVWGGDLSVSGEGVVDGDSLQVKLVDVDGIMSPAGTVLKTFITKKFIPSTRVISMTAPDSGAVIIPGGLYLRFIYSEVSVITKTITVNINAMS